MAREDDLSERMDSRLRLNVKRPSHPRERRFSDTDRPDVSISESIGPELATSNRQLPSLPRTPVPMETSHIFSHRPAPTTAIEAPPCPAVEHLPSHNCKNSVCSVTEVLAITELRELMLNQLDTANILALRLVGKSWNATIANSPTLRLHLFVRPQWARPTSDFQLLPLSIPGLSIKLGEPIHLGQWIEVSMTLESARLLCEDQARRPRARSFYEGMKGGLGPDRGPIVPGPYMASTTKVQYNELFTTQPPVVGAQAFFLSPPSFNESADSEASGPTNPVLRGPCAKLSSDAGITLGFLAGTAINLFAYKWSGAMSSEDGQKEGDVIVYKTIVSFCPNDRTLRQRKISRGVTMLWSQKGYEGHSGERFDPRESRSVNAIQTALLDTAKLR